MHGSASLAPDWPVRKATPADDTARTARSGVVVETVDMSRPQRAQCAFYTKIRCTPHAEIKCHLYMGNKASKNHNGGVA